MGVWAQPNTHEKADQLEEIFKNPLAAKDTDSIAQIVGEDALFDLIGEISDDDPNSDIRYTVAERAALFAAAAIDPDYFAEHFGRWNVEWEDGVAERVLDMSTEIVNKHSLAGFSYPLAQWVDARQSTGMKL